MKTVSIVLSAVLSILASNSFAASMTIKGDQAQVQYYALKALYDSNAINNLKNTVEHKYRYSKDSGGNFRKYTNGDTSCEVEIGRLDFTCTYLLSE